MSVSRPVPDDLALALGAEYEIIGELGRGGVSVVYLARDRELGREVAIKVIRDAYSGDGEAVARFEREARMLARMQHPNIVTLYAARRLSAGGLALVMQYGQWRTLKAVISELGPLPVPTAEAVLRDLAGALAYLHRNGIVHRDIKPENVFVEPETGRALLSDFGLAKPGGGTENVTLAGVVIGTPAYMSPEQVDGGEVDGQSDLYSLGMVGYEMLTGRRPWEGESLFNVIYKQKTEQLPALAAVRPELPPSLCRAVEGAIEKERAARWSGADAMLAELSAGAPAARPEPLPPLPLAPAPAPQPEEAPTVQLGDIAAALAAEPFAEAVPEPRLPRLRPGLVAASLLLVLVAGVGAVAMTVGVRAEAVDAPLDGSSVAALPAQRVAPPEALPLPAPDPRPDAAEPAPDPAPEPRREPEPERPRRPAAAPAAAPVAAAAATGAESVATPLLSQEVPAPPSLIAREEARPRSEPVLGPVPFTPRMTPPQLRNQETVARALAASYPRRLRRQGIGGTVHVSVLVDVRGTVVRAQMVGTSGHPELDAVALEVARAMRFTPGTSQRVPVETWVRIPLLFQADLLD